jgi:hypothetical protein
MKKFLEGRKSNIMVLMWQEGHVAASSYSRMHYLGERMLMHKRKRDNTHSFYKITTPVMMALVYS